MEAPSPRLEGGEGHASARASPGSRSRYLDLFVQESAELLEGFDEEVARLELGEGGDLDELFRVAHSLKGAASAMGFGDMVELTHELESLLAGSREAPTSRDAALFADLLARVGLELGRMVAAHAAGEEPARATELVEELRSIEVEAGPGARPASDRASPSSLHSTTRVRTDALDDLLDEAGELVLALARLREEAKEAGASGLDRSVGKLQRSAKHLHAKVLTARLTPLKAIADRLRALVRGAAEALGKEVQLELSGGELELDRAVLEGLVDPLGHLLRNGIHHGIEPAVERKAAAKAAAGRLRLEASRSRDRMHLVVEDDGRGIDVDRLRQRALELGLLPAEALGRMSREEALQLCFLPGLSTADTLSELAGRGIGMDQVLRSVERLGGQISIESEPGEGTRFLLDLPLGISLVQVLLVGVGDQSYALSLSRVVAAGVAAEERAGLDLHSLETLLEPQTHGPRPRRSGVRQSPAQTSRPSSRGLGSHEDAHPIGFDTNDPEKQPSEDAQRPFVVVEVEGGRLALEVDRLVGYEEAVLRPLTPPLDRLPGTSGVLLLGTGRPVFLLDLQRLLVPEAVALRSPLR